MPTELLRWPGYTGYYNPAERPGYSGVALLCKEPPLFVSKGLGEERFDVEGRVLVADYADFRLFNAYFPNGGQGEDRLRYKMDFYAATSAYALASDKPLIVCGDVNTAHQPIDLARPKENEKNTGFLPMERAWIDEFLALGFLDSFRLFHYEGGHYSWWDMKTRARERNIGWRIDYFFVAEPLRQRIKDAYILPAIEGSDHCPVVLEIE